MKTKSIVLSLALCFCFAMVSNAAPLVKPSKSISSHIQKALFHSNIDFNKYNGETVKIHFMVNESNQIIVVSTDNDELDSIVKKSLNFGEVNSEELEPLQLYKVNVVLKHKWI